MRFLLSSILLILLSQAPAALAACAIEPDANGHVTIPDDWTSIASYAFSSCTSQPLTSITIPDTVTSIDNNAFANSGLQTLTIPDSVTSLGSNLCLGCTSLTSVIIGNNVPIINEESFRFCSSLTSVSIGNSVTTIDDGAFMECTSLTSVTIPDSVTTLEPLVFYGCTSLTSVTLTDSITSMADQSPFTDTAINQVCGVDATQEPFSSQPQLQVQDTQAQCTEPACPDGVSDKSWCRPLACTSPDTTGYAVTETDLALDSFDVTVTCASPYVGTASVSACSADGEAYSLSGCSCGGFTPLGGICTAYSTTCPDNEYLSGGSATADKDCIPCAADKKSYGGAPCKKVVDCLTATEQGHRNIDVGYASGDYTVSMS